MPAEIIYRKTVDIDTLHDNPRFIKDQDFKELCKSIQDNPEYFEARPILLSNRTGLLVVIAGNMRLRAAVDLGLKEVPTILLAGLSEEKEREIIIRDNVNNGSWDYDLLANNWDKDQLIEWGVPALWDLEPEEEDQVPEVNETKAKLTIEFESFAQMDEAKTELEELLRSYSGASIR